MFRSITRLLLVLLLVAVSASCGGGEDRAETQRAASPTAVIPSPEQTTPLANGETAAFHGVQDVSGMSQLELELDDNYFEPTVLEGTAGQAIELKMFNEGEALHNLSVTEQGIDQDVQAGQRDVTVRVTFPASGSLVFVCKYHLALNMRGELRVKS